MFSRLAQYFMSRIRPVFKNPNIFNPSSKRWGKINDFVVPFMMSLTLYNNFDDTKKKSEYNFLKSSDELAEDLSEKVFTSPEPELLEIMNVLKDCIVESCVQYRTCIKKQIEIIEKSTQTGFHSSTLDDLPEYRTLANDLNHELNNYVVLLRTVGEMTFQHLVTSVRGGTIANVNMISEKYKDLEIVLQKQLDENRKCETALNAANRNMILNARID